MKCAGPTAQTLRKAFPRGPWSRLECLVQKLGVMHLGLTGFEILGNLLKVACHAAERFFEILLPRRFGQLPSMVR
jgi:hypothetical protein